MTKPPRDPKEGTDQTRQRIEKELAKGKDHKQVRDEAAKDWARRGIKPVDGGKK